MCNKIYIIYIYMFFVSQTDQVFTNIYYECVREWGIPPMPSGNLYNSTEMEDPMENPMENLLYQQENHLSLSRIRQNYQNALCFPSIFRQRHGAWPRWKPMGGCSNPSRFAGSARLLRQRNSPATWDEVLPQNMGSLWDFGWGFTHQIPERR